MLNVNSWLLTAAEVYQPGMVLRTGSVAWCGTAVWAAPALGFMDVANCSPKPLHTAYTRQQPALICASKAGCKL